MMRLFTLGAVGLVLAAVIPYAYYSLSDPYRASKPVGSSEGGGSTLGAISSFFSSRLTVPASIAGTPEAVRHDLAAVLRFDRTPGWVAGQWPRVSTGMGQLQLQGYRVPLVTGMGEDDVAGALTYYFNPQQQVQRIALYGTTGNPQKLVGHLTTQFGFTQRLINDPGVMFFEVREPSGFPKSVLRVEPSVVIRQAMPNQRFRVSLVLERPGTPR